MLTVTTNAPGLEDKHLSASALPELFVLVSLAVDEVDAQQVADGDAGSEPADPDAIAVDPADESDAHVSRQKMRPWTSWLASVPTCGAVASRTSLSAPTTNSAPCVAECLSPSATAWA